VAKVSVVLRAAVLDKLIASNPVDGVRLPRQRKAEAAMAIPTPDQVGQVIAAATPDFAPFLAVCAFGGLRLGETAGLQLGDIDFLRRTITVSRQVQREPVVGFEVRPPKFGSERVVYVPAALVEILAEHVRTTGREHWLFTGETGTMPLHQGTVGHRWRSALKAAGLSGFRLHDLRHFYASGLIASGCDVVTVQRALGHGSATVTLSTYSHLWPSAEDRTRTAAAAMLAQAINSDIEKEVTQ
jgi:integrase